MGEKNWIVTPQELLLPKKKKKKKKKEGKEKTQVGMGAISLPSVSLMLLLWWWCEVTSTEGSTAGICSQVAVDGSTPPPRQNTYQPAEPIKGFYQWENNNGYCGEVILSFVTNNKSNYCLFPSLSLSFCVCFLCSLLSLFFSLQFNRCRSCNQGWR